MRKILMLAVAFLVLLIGSIGVPASSAAADTECTIPISFALACARYCGSPTCGSEPVCVSPTAYDCVCVCP
jgi:hypothetical protein